MIPNLSSHEAVHWSTPAGHQWPHCTLFIDPEHPSLPETPAKWPIDLWPVQRNHFSLQVSPTPPHPNMHPKQTYPLQLIPSPHFHCRWCPIHGKLTPIIGVETPPQNQTTLTLPRRQLLYIPPNTYLNQSVTLQVLIQVLIISPIFTCKTVLGASQSFHTFLTMLLLESMCLIIAQSY